MPAWVDGKVVGDNEPAIPAFDRGFLWADGVFETVRVDRGIPLFLDEHLERLSTSAAILGVPSVPDSRWTEAIVSLAPNPERVERLRLILTRGDADDLAPRAAPTVRPVAVLSALHLRTTVTAAFVPDGRAREIPRPKTLDYRWAIAALSAARLRGCEEALAVDETGRVLDATTANLFAVCDGAVQTPPLSLGILAGTTRAQVLRLAAGEGMSASETVLFRGDLLSADELFLTSSISGVVPIVRVEQSQIGNGRIGKTTARLAAAWSELCNTEIRRTEMRWRASTTQKGIVK